MIPFTPGHKVTFEQLSKDLQDRFIQAQANLKEIEAKVEEAKKKIIQSLLLLKVQQR